MTSENLWLTNLSTLNIFSSALLHKLSTEKKVGIRKFV